MRASLIDARHSLARVPEADRDALTLKIEAADRALGRYVKLVESQDAHAARRGALMVAGGTVVADDLTGVGVGDDVLLPFLALGLLAIELSGPPSQSETDAAWAATLAALSAVSQAAEAIRAQGRTSAKRCFCFCIKAGVMEGGKKLSDLGECGEYCAVEFRDRGLRPLCR